MTEETLEAAILQLKGKALEALGIMKDIARRPTREGDVDALAIQASKLAHLEGSMLTLQQYAPQIVAAGKIARANAFPAPVENEDEEPKVETSPSVQSVGEVPPVKHGGYPVESEEAE